MDRYTTALMINYGAIATIKKPFYDCIERFFYFNIVISKAVEPKW